MEIYIARREIFKYTVSLEKNGIFKGQVQDRSEQIILGSSPKFIKIPSAPFIQDKDLKKSPIILIPIENSYDCKKLMANRNNLFPKNNRP